MIGQIGLFMARAGFYSGARAPHARDSRGPSFRLGTWASVLVVIGYAGVVLRAG